MRNELIECISEFDDQIMEDYLEGKEISVEVIKKAIRKGVLAVKFFPVFCGSALSNMGVKLALDAVIDYLPAPTDIPAIKGVDLNDNPVSLHEDVYVSICLFAQ